jgi:hypothetical protein
MSEGGADLQPLLISRWTPKGRSRLGKSFHFEIRSFDRDRLDHRPGFQSRLKPKPLDGFPSHERMKVARAKVKGDAGIGGFEIFDLDDDAGQAVCDGNVHRPRQSDRDVAGIDDDLNARPRLCVDFGHAKLKTAEEQRRNSHLGMVAPDARLERGG